MLHSPTRQSVQYIKLHTCLHSPTPTLTLTLTLALPHSHSHWRVIG
jgi:hypothetical protein